MILAAGILIVASTFGGHGAHRIPLAIMVGYVIGFVALFIVSGIGNGSVYKMIPSTFEARSHLLQIDEAERRQWSRSMSGALIGIAGAIGALGRGGCQPGADLYSVTATSAFWAFMFWYVASAALTWAVYIRRPVEVIAPTETEAPAVLAHV